MKIRAFISLLLGLSIFTSQINSPLHATDTFQNSITLDQTKLIETIEGVCPDDPIKSKQIRINDAIQKNAETYLLWSYTCEDTSAGSSTIMISIKADGLWSSHTVSSERKFYVDRNYLGAPNFVDLNDGGVGIVWADLTANPGRPDLMGKIFDGTDASTLAGTEFFTIASSTECNIGNILPVSNSYGVFLIYLTNNGGAESCMGDLYATQFSSGSWESPVLINASDEVSDLYRENNLAITSSGDAYICYTTSPRYENPGNQVKVVKFSDGVSSVEYSGNYPNIETNSAHYCSIEVDQFDQPHLLVGEIAWTRSASGSGTSISANPASRNFREFTIVEDLWEESEGSLDVINSNLDDSFTYASFCSQCQERMTLIVTSESSKIKLYSYGADKNWTLSRNFNEDYDQDVQNVQEVWGNSTLGYTFLINNFAEELSGDFGYQKGHFLDIKPTFSPPSVNKLLFSDSIYEVASQIFLDEFETIFTRLTSRGVIKIGNSIVSMWEDLGSGSTPPRTIFIERILKEIPSCTDSNFAPGKPTGLAAASVYTTAILSFVQSQCGSSATQATVEVKNVTTGATREVVITNPGLSLEIPNLEQGNSYTFKVRLTNNYGASSFTSYSNLVVATRPVSRPPSEIVIPKVEALDTTKETETGSTPEKNKPNDSEPSSVLKISDNATTKLKSLGLRLVTAQSTGDVTMPSPITTTFSTTVKSAKSINLSGKKFFEINVKSFTTERVKAQVKIGKKVVNLGYVTPTPDSVLKLPPMSFKPGKYLFRFSSLSGKAGFVSVTAK
jgi:hypothetical protein